jgi:hypothetical protein
VHRVRLFTSASAFGPESNEGTLDIVLIVIEQSASSAVCFNQWSVYSALTTENCYLVSDIQRAQVVIVLGIIPTVLKGVAYNLP